MSIKISEEIFGIDKDPLTGKNAEIKQYTLVNSQNVTVQVLTLGATINTIRVPDMNGHLEDVSLGFDSIEAYQKYSPMYFGSTIGRVCNRISNASFTLNGQLFEVSKNMLNTHILHGGYHGFSRTHWKGSICENSVIMTHISPDGDEGFPGEVCAKVIFSLTEDNELHIKFTATSDKTTIINMTNHAYFNLAGHGAGPQELFDHTIQILADKYSVTNDILLPTGELHSVEGTSHDLRSPVHLGGQIKKTSRQTFDDNFCVNSNQNGINVIAKVVHSKTGRYLEVATDQPAVQFYTSNNLPDPDKGDEPLHGKQGANYIKYGAFCLETQKHPDAPNHSNFPSIVINPGHVYNHEVIYKFGVS